MHDGSIARAGRRSITTSRAGAPPRADRLAGNGKSESHKDPLIVKLTVTPEERSDIIIEFLKSLTDNDFLSNPATLTPWVESMNDPRHRRRGPGARRRVLVFDDATTPPDYTDPAPRSPRAATTSQTRWRWSATSSVTLAIRRGWSGLRECLAVCPEREGGTALRSRTRGDARVERRRARSGVRPLLRLHEGELLSGVANHRSPTRSAYTGVRDCSRRSARASRGSARTPSTRASGDAPGDHATSKLGTAE